jgi:hypothetical protein
MLSTETIVTPSNGSQQQEESEHHDRWYNQYKLTKLHINAHHSRLDFTLIKSVN